MGSRKNKVTLILHHLKYKTLLGGVGVQKSNTETRNCGNIIFLLGGLERLGGLAIQPIKNRPSKSRSTIFLSLGMLRSSRYLSYPDFLKIATTRRFRDFGS